MLAKLDITPGEHAEEPAKHKAQVWAAIEDQKDVAEAMRLDEAGEVAKALAGGHVEGVESSDEEEDGIDDGCPEGGGADPPSYAELSQLFGALENYASECGLTGASNLLKKASMVMIEAHASKPVRQSDLRELF